MVLTDTTMQSDNFLVGCCDYQNVFKVKGLEFFEVMQVIYWRTSCIDES